MMERQEVVDFILSEVKRLNEEEHIHDLNKAGRYEELSRVECKNIRGVADYLLRNNLELRAEEIPEGGFLAVAIWNNVIDMAGTVKFDDEFEEKFVAEGGKLAKSVVYKMKENGFELEDLDCDEFFDASDADKYDALMIQ